MAFVIERGIAPRSMAMMVTLLHNLTDDQNWSQRVIMRLVSIRKPLELARRSNGDVMRCSTPTGGGRWWTSLKARAHAFASASRPTSASWI
nr:hypothetical protein CFP56_01464 [Quercus suber]